VLPKVKQLTLIAKRAVKAVRAEELGRK
jgi:hypothetical protein